MIGKNLIKAFTTHEVCALIHLLIIVEAIVDANNAAHGVRFAFFIGPEHYSSTRLAPCCLYARVRQHVVFLFHIVYKLNEIVSALTKPARLLL